MRSPSLNLLCQPPGLAGASKAQSPAPHGGCGEAEAAGVREKCCLGTLCLLRALGTVYLQSVSRLLLLGSCGESPRHSGLKLRSFWFLICKMGLVLPTSPVVGRI